MSEKFLHIIQRFSQSDLLQFLQKNGYGEFVEVLNKGGITDGEAFLNLNELQMLKWKLPLSTKRKLLFFLNEIKQNAQKFVGKVEIDKFGSVNRRQSFVRPKNDFREKLEQVISPKPPEPKSVRKPPAILPKSNLEVPSKSNLEVPESPNEYLDMNSGSTENLLHDHYDESGYLLPSEKMQSEENDYEPPPSNILINPGRSIFQRAPLALPRDTTDDRGYIRGPANPIIPMRDAEAPAPVIPRVQKNNFLFSSPGTTPSPTLPRPFPKALPSQAEREAEEELVDYEHIDEEKDFISSSVKPVTVENQTGSLSRLLGFLKKGKKAEPEQNGSKESRQQDANKGKRIQGRANHQPSARYVTRPLPALPPRQFFGSSENLKKQSQSVEDIADDNYENTLDLKEDTKNGKSQSESDLSVGPEGELPTYGNIEEEKKPKFQESYEKHHIKKKIDNISLPLPPRMVPQITVCEETLQGEEYGKYVFNPNNEPFYRNTDRKGARRLLDDLGDGAFLFRRSRRFFLSLCLKYKNEYHNIGVEKNEEDIITLNGGMSPKFDSLHDLIEHFTRELLTYKHNGELIETYLRKTLPLDRF